ncbi:MAG: hypothetical protein IKH67_06620 [Lachnospiraceae bacterium]|nr:hypothetical protein [Lachnospiraceae bacterium]MBR3004720.1 hypothetical protein [Lachnospiraceae bacterium]MBR6350630.1 hypothetical protein [Lachnospiraceae bacterium]
MKKNENDDGRVLADMSELERRPLLFPHLHRPEKLTKDKEEPKINNEDDEVMRSVRGSAVRGALMAGLIVAGVLIAGMGLVILIILLIGKLNGTL